MEISGTAAIVTGGASGLGGATARALAARGAQVFALDLPGAIEKADAIVAETGPQPPWWAQPTPFTFKGVVPQTLSLYRAPNGAFVRNQAYNNAYDINVQAVTPDGWLFVSGWHTPDNAGDDLWLRASDVTPA